ncbi:MAG: hypothetical protein KDB50_14505, partial [Mycobacterium sp.]|nr:hypothetical protein [Mycobacterium sp.]
MPRREDPIRVTIHDPARLGGDADRRSDPEADTRTDAGRDGLDVIPSGTVTSALVDRLNAGEPYAVVFGGQGDSSWLAGLEELVTSAGIESELSRIVGEADLLLEPVAGDLVVVRPIGFQPLTWVRALAAGDQIPTAAQLTSAAVSMPGVLLTQIAAVRALARQGIDFAAAPPVGLAG